MTNFHPIKKTQQNYVYSGKILITYILEIKFRHSNSSRSKIFMTGKGLNCPQSLSVNYRFQQTQKFLKEITILLR